MIAGQFLPGLPKMRRHRPAWRRPARRRAGAGSSRHRHPTAAARTAAGPKIIGLDPTAVGGLGRCLAGKTYSHDQREADRGCLLSRRMRRSNAIGLRFLGHLVHALFRRPAHGEFWFHRRYTRRRDFPGFHYRFEASPPCILDIFTTCCGPAAPWRHPVGRCNRGILRRAVPVSVTRSHPASHRSLRRPPLPSPAREA